jgi:hypothetical protein
MAEKMSKPTSGAPRRGPIGMGPVWKSSVLAGGIGGVLLGWALLVNTTGPATAQTAASQAAMASSQSAIAAPRAAAPAGKSQTPQSSLRSIPAMPQQPQFSRPLTRTRRS